MRRLKLVTVDLDDTLWPCRSVIQAAEASLFDWLREHAPAITAVHDVDSLRVQRMALVVERPELAHDLTRLRLVQLEGLMSEHGYDPELAQRASSHFRRQRNRVTPYPDVVDGLRALGRHCRLVSLTNGNAQVEQTPLAGCFDHNLTAADVGAAKPDPALFHAACEWAGVRPEQALHVGDDPERDIAPARAIGMRTAWINRNGAPWPEPLPAADLQAADMTELVNRLIDTSKEPHP